MRRALLLTFGFLASATAVRAQTVTIRPAGDLSSLVGMPLDVPIVADWTARADKLGSFALTLRWDPTILRYEGGAPGTFGQLISNSDSAAQGVLRLSGANPNGVNGMITLGVGRFTPLATTGTTLQLQVSELYATAPSFADLIASAAPQNALYCAARGLWGDPDVDGTVGSRDALLALSNAVGLDVSAFPEIGLADVDTSGTADARDALVILSYAVGMDVNGFRIHKLALGSCGTEVQTNYAILPASDTLLKSQDLRLTLQATSTLGAVRTLSDVFWRSSNPTVVAVTQDGRAVAAGTGVATLVGKSGATDSAIAVLTVLASRSHHWVDAAAISATNRIGSAALPFASLPEAAAITAEGDTVFVRPGHYADPAFFNQGVVILGQPGAGGVVLSTGASGAISFLSGRRAEVRNVTIDNSRTGIEAFGLDTLLVDSLSYTAAAGSCVAEAVGSGDIRQLAVRRSTLTGDGPGGCTTGIDAFGVVQDLTVDGVVFSDLGNDAISAGSADSVTVRASVFHDIGSSAVDVAAGTCCATRLPAPTSLALVFDGNRTTTTGYSPVYATQLRSAVLSHSLLDGRTASSQVLALLGPNLTPAGYARLTNDTVLGFVSGTGGNDWLEAISLDSAVVDSVVASGLEGSFSSVTSVRVTRSRITVAGAGTGLAVDPSTLGGAFVVDSVTITGDAACSQCANGIFADRLPVTVSHFTGSNLNYALQLYDSTVSVTHSTISNSFEGVYTNGGCCGGTVPTTTVRDLTVTQTNHAVDVQNMVLVADSLTLSAGTYGVSTVGGGADTVRNSTIADFQYATDLEADTVYAAGNTILRPTSEGIQVFGVGSPFALAQVSGNTVTCDATGAQTADGIYAASGSSRISGNTLSGCASAVYASNYTGTPYTIDVRGNTITAPAQSNDGAIHITYGLVPTVAGNQITGGGHWGAIWLDGYFLQEFTRARVDSNVIQNVPDRAIFVAYADTLIARGNLIEDVTSTGYYSAGALGISLYGDIGEDTLIANTLRRVHGRGFELNLATADVVADSNAISHADSAAIYVLGLGAFSMTGNNIQNNHKFGLNNPNATGASFAVQGNAFVNDSVYAIASPTDTVHAQGNWWGLATGSHSGAGSDSTFGNVDTTAYLTTDPTPLLPALAPPIRVIAARTAPSLTSVPRRTYVAPLRASRPAPAPVALNARQMQLADRMAAASGGTSPVAKALASRAEQLRARAQADAQRAQQRADQAAAQLERQRQIEAARAARAARTAPQKGRAGQ